MRVERIAPLKTLFRVTCGAMLLLTCGAMLLCLLLRSEPLAPADGWSDALASRNTRLLLGWGQIVRKGDAAFFMSNEGEVGAWDAETRRLVSRDAPIKLTCGGRIISTPRAEQILISTYGLEPRLLLFVNVRTLEVERRIRAPFDGPCGDCFINPKLLALSGWRDADNGRLDREHQLTFFHIDEDRLTAAATFRHPGGSYRIKDVRRVTDEQALVLCCVTAPERQTQKETGEMCLVDAMSARILHRVATRATGEERWTSRVSRGGGYVVSCQDSLIELRELPTLAIVRQLSVRDPHSPPVLAAISHDGRYVAFGVDQVELWDTTTGQLRTLDSLNSRVARHDKPFLPFLPGAQHANYMAEYFVRYQYCVTDIAFIEDRYEFDVLTHDGVFAAWDASKGKCLRRDQIAKVVYLAAVPDAQRDP